LVSAAGTLYVASVASAISWYVLGLVGGSVIG
jgi:hypothetical protein